MGFKPNLDNWDLNEKTSNNYFTWLNNFNFIWYEGNSNCLFCKTTTKIVNLSKIEICPIKFIHYFAPYDLMHCIILHEHDVKWGQWWMEKQNFYCLRTTCCAFQITTPWNLFLRPELSLILYLPKKNQNLWWNVHYHSYKKSLFWKFYIWDYRRMKNISIMT